MEFFHKTYILFFIIKAFYFYPIEEKNFILVKKNYFITPLQNQGFPDAWEFFIV
jgi:hypothetical protein